MLCCWFRPVGENQQQLCRRLKLLLGCEHIRYVKRSDQMNETSLLADLRRHWEYEGKDYDISHEIYHDDAVLEFPQSQERFEGKVNFLTWRKRYPAALEFKIRRIRGRGDFWVAENAIRYNGETWNYTCSILEFRGDKIARETIYISQGWDAPDWRAPWRSEWQDEALG
jgi:hypothetical protein